MDALAHRVKALIDAPAIAEARYPSLEGRAVLVTGGGAGIGADLVRAFASQGARVAFLERDAAAAERSAAAAIQEMRATPPLFEVVDLRDIDAARAAIDRLGARLGGFDALVNNAGNDDRLPLEEVTPEYWDDRLAVNLRHYFFCAQAVAADLARKGGGAIVNLGSNSWMQGAAGLICYTTAKSAVSGLTRGLARELGDRGIRVNAIAPGWVLTERQVERADRIYPDKYDDYLTRQCLKRHLEPADVSRMALFLASDDARMVTSQTFIVDGGVV